MVPDRIIRSPLICPEWKHFCFNDGILIQWRYFWKSDSSFSQWRYFGCDGNFLEFPGKKYCHAQNRGGMTKFNAQLIEWWLGYHLWCDSTVTVFFLMCRWNCQNSRWYQGSSGILSIRWRLTVFFFERQWRQFSYGGDGIIFQFVHFLMCLWQCFAKVTVLLKIQGR